MTQNTEIQMQKRRQNYSKHNARRLVSLHFEKRKEERLADQDLQKTLRLEYRGACLQNLEQSQPSLRFELNRPSPRNSDKL